MWQAPVWCPDQPIEPDWIDYNGHLNLAYYHVLFDRGVDHVYDQLEIGADYAREGGGSCFTMETHVSYLSELTVDDPVKVSLQLVDHDAKRLHFFQTMVNGNSGELAATLEQLAIHVDMTTRKSAPFPDQALARITALKEAHAALPRPAQLGSVIGIRR